MGLQGLAGCKGIYTRIDYFETFSLVVKLTSLRLVLALVATKHWFIHQLDVDSAFLHGYSMKKFS